MKCFYDNNYKLGILGGGQLGRMLIQKAIDLNVNTYVLDADENAPCKSLCTGFTKGSVSDYQTVLDFGKELDLITIEFEHVNVDALEALEKMGKKVFPQPRVIRLVQDKGLQKEFYRSKELPTADFKLIENREGLRQEQHFLPFFQKLRKSGYDGKGVMAVNSESAFGNAFDAPSVLEKYIDFDKEIAVIAARNEEGEVNTFPVVELEFNREANLVEYLFSPADISAAVAEKARSLATQVIQSLEMVGILAVEMFLTKEGEILINEIAPRPHNSGHQTIEGNCVSQYEQHLRAILNLPLGKTDILFPSVMLNLLGEKGHEGKASYNNLKTVLSEPGVYVHLYGKTTTKPFRKMGHVTVINKNLDIARKKAEEIKKTLTITSK